MSQTSSYDVVVGEIATVMRVDTIPTENIVEPGNYSFAGVLETMDTQEGIGGKTVNLVVDGAVVSSQPTTTPAGGWQFNFFLEPGTTYDVKATFDGDASYGLSETPTYSVTPTVELIPTVMPVSTAPPSTVDAGVSFNFDGNLREEVGLAGIVGRTIDLYIDGAPSGMTDATATDGYWAFLISFPEAGTHSVYAIFPGDATYSGCPKELSTRGPLLAVAGVLAGLVGIACLRH